jgi:GNAT superfamily N-acetyltransferase
MISNFTIRPARLADTEALFKLIQALADYEKLTDQVIGTADLLKQHLFGAQPCVEAIVAEIAQQVVGFALFFPNYSTFLTQPGLYLEDLFVLPDYRSQGIGKALITTLAQIAHARGCGRLEWSVLDWNKPAIAFYQNLGADIRPDWRTCRVTGPALIHLATR